jgi:ribosomal protein L15
MELLNIGYPIYYEIKKIAFPEEKRKTEYSEEDIKKLRKVLSERNKEKEQTREDNKEEKLFTDLEEPGENEYYAKLLKNGENWSVGVYNSTNLTEDIKKFKAQNLELRVICEKEAKTIYKELFCRKEQ